MNEVFENIRDFSEAEYVNSSNRLITQRDKRILFGLMYPHLLAKLMKFLAHTKSSSTHIHPESTNHSPAMVL